MKRIIVSLLCFALGAAWALPNVESAKMPPSKDPVTGFSTQPEAFYLLVDGTKYPCATEEVKSTGTRQMKCDLESLPPGVYKAVAVAVKTSNGMETPTDPLRLTISKKYSGRTYNGQRLYTTAYTLGKW